MLTAVTQFLEILKKNIKKKPQLEFLLLWLPSKQVKQAVIMVGFIYIFGIPFRLPVAF